MGIDVARLESRILAALFGATLYLVNGGDTLFGNRLQDW